MINGVGVQIAEANGEEEEVEYAVDNRPQKVIEGLFIGSAWAEMNEPGLTKAGITHILQVAQGLFPRFPLQFTYMILQVEDAPATDLVCHFPACFEFIESARNQGGAVLVHCAAGVSRSATVVLGYLMSSCKLSLAASLEHLKEVRPWVAPNIGFMQQLEAFEAAGCDLSGWKPWHQVYHQQQQQGGPTTASGTQQPALPPQPQQWLQLPQPNDCQQPQASQQRQQAACEGAAAAAGSTLQPPT